jgi:hypothetical protein
MRAYPGRNDMGYIILTVGSTFIFSHAPDSPVVLLTI